MSEVAPKRASSGDVSGRIAEDQARDHVLLKMGFSNPSPEEKLESSLLQALRQGTAKQHEDLHRHPLSQRLLKPATGGPGGFDAQDYARLLASFLGPWRRLDASAARLPALTPYLAGRLGQLESDLATLGSSKPPSVPAEPESLDVDSSLGHAYALVGSSLGARELCAALHRHAPNAPARFLSHSPRRSGWPTLVGLLRELPAQQHPRAVAGAQRCFTEIARGWNAR